MAFVNADTVRHGSVASMYFNVIDLLKKTRRRRQKLASAALFLRVGLSLLAMSCCMQTHADTLSRPPISGYVFAASFYKNGEDLGDYFCTHNLGPATKFGHVVYGVLPKSSVVVYCLIAPGVERTHDTWGFNWKTECQEGQLNSEGMCNASVDKAPIPPSKACNCEASTKFGNPIDAANGEKTQEEQDYPPVLGLAFTRHYSSLNNGNSKAEQFGFFNGWRHTYTKMLVANMADPARLVAGSAYPAADKYTFTASGWEPKFISEVVSGNSSVYITRPDGYVYYFQSKDNGITWHTDSDVIYRLSINKTDAQNHILEWKLTTDGDDQEFYNERGQLSSIQLKSGGVQTLTYSDASTPKSSAFAPGLLIRVEDNFGRSLHFAYDDAGHMRQLTDPAGLRYLYDFDKANNLISVTYPDGLHRMYHYGEAAHISGRHVAIMSNFLTGISDEISAGHIVRYATFTYGDGSRYDYPMKVLSTEHAGGADKFVFDFKTGYITDPLGQKISLDLRVLNGVKMVHGVRKTTASGELVQTISYDKNNNYIGHVDYNGVKTTYGYDLTRNLETSRVEAAGSANAITISTAWNPNFRLPDRITGPLLRTTYTYDAKGNRLSKTEQATQDATGAEGLNVAVVGAPRTWTTSYTPTGQIASVTGPRTDVHDVSHFAYDHNGNLTSFINAAGQVTTFSQYDPNGHVGSMTDPNGLVTTFSYNLRGWVIRQARGNEITHYQYDGVGQITSVTLPNGATLNYHYDDAHRLAGIADSMGNRVSYTLDAMGNRLREQQDDASGNLTRQITRVYSALNRLEHITGAN